jgi:hypothetical protein
MNVGQLSKYKQIARHEANIGGEIGNAVNKKTHTDDSWARW